MRVAVLTLCYNEEDTIGGVIKNWEGLVEKHLVLHSDKPWHGGELPPDETENIVKRFKHTEFIRIQWDSETQQRNWGLGRLYDFDYVLIVDADEFYERKDCEKIINYLGKEKNKYDNVDCYRVSKINTYFKDLDYRLDPRDTHEPVIALNPKKIVFTEHRCVNTQCQIPFNLIMHHTTYCRNRNRLASKLEQFEHHDSVKSFWIEEVYDKWNPQVAEGMDNLRAYGHENSKAIYDPAPQEIRFLISP